MDGSPSSVISVGFGSWGSVGLVVTLGFGVGEAVVDPATLHGWLEYAVAGRLHYEVEGRLHYDVEGRLHYTPGSQDI